MTTINSYVFYNNFLEKIDIPASITRIREGVFAGHPNHITNVTLSVSLFKTITGSTGDTIPTQLSNEEETALGGIFGEVQIIQPQPN